KICVVPQRQQRVRFSRVRRRNAAPDQVEQRARRHLRGFQRSLCACHVRNADRHQRGNNQRNSNGPCFHRIAPRRSVKKKSTFNASAAGTRTKSPVPRGVSRTRNRGFFDRKSKTLSSYSGFAGVPDPATGAAAAVGGAAAPPSFGVAR